MTLAPELPIEIIGQPGRLQHAVSEMTGLPAIVLDTESNSFHHYPEQLCLIQIATRSRVYIVDSITLLDLAPLGTIFADATIRKVIHGADYDIRSLDRHSGLRIHNLYDTSIAARFAGMAQFGLAALLKDLLGVTINKSKKLQRADWGRRPLNPEELQYAATDVRYLFALAELLGQRVETLHRTAWVAEECARLEEVRFTPPNLETAWLSLKGINGLDAAALAVLRSLYMFREGEARRRGRPPFYMFPDDTLIYLAANPTAALSEVPGLGQVALQRFGPGLRQALKDGMSAPPFNRPPPSTAERLSREQVQRLGGLKEWRTALGAALSLDPSLLWPAVSLERLARTPRSLDAELASPDIRRWQREQFAAALRTRLASLR